MIRPLSRVMILAAALLAMSAQGAGANSVRNYKPCGITLRAMSRTMGASGDVFQMHGKWGARQGAKTPRINRGDSNALEVLSWTDETLTVRIPPGLKPGTYKVGVYCNDLSLGGSYSSGWKNFVVIPARGALMKTVRAKFQKAAARKRPERAKKRARDRTAGKKSDDSWKYVLGMVGFMFLYFIRAGAVVDAGTIPRQEVPQSDSYESAIGRRKAQEAAEALKLRLEQKKRDQGREGR